MLDIISSNQFKRDLRLAQKRGFRMDRLKAVVTALASGETLSRKCRDHSLSGNYSGFRECHVEPDWLLVYRIDNDVLALFLFRTGTHADVFH